MAILAYMYVHLKFIFAINLCNSSDNVICFNLISKTLNGFHGDKLNLTVYPLKDLPCPPFLSVKIHNYMFAM